MANNWFPHDSSASTDQKILLLRSEFGNVGYAWYFMILEWLWQTADGKSPYNIDSISFFLHEDRTIIERYIQRCIDLELFIREKNEFYSFRLTQEKDFWLEKSKNGKRAVAIREAKKKKIDENKEKNTSIERSSDDISNDHPVPTNRTNQPTVPTSMSDKSDAKIQVMNELEIFSRWLSGAGIFSDRKTITEKAKKKWNARRSKYSPAEITNAFSNLVNEPDRWKLNNNGHRPISWWLDSDDRLEEMKNCHLKRSANQKPLYIIP